MKWWIGHILIWLTLGTITTISVSWVAMYCNYRKYKYERIKAFWVDESHPLRWMTIVDKDSWFTQVTYSFHDYSQNPEQFAHDAARVKSSPLGLIHPNELLPYWASHLFSDKADFWTEKDGSFTHGVIASGWPYRAMKYEKIGAFVDSKVQVLSGNLRFDVGKDRISGSTIFIYLPCLPIWPGFVIDTLIFCTPWIFVFGGLGVVRRAIRTKRGRCPLCAYNLLGEIERGCPECGWNRSAINS